ncbi:MAG: 23S rRNA (adenine(2503)-C(2))-methyltransferase RlmN [Lentisphaeria bacterium]|nr:23S rRNA (adenine(2503)-C(2))-methyltransferase RlmN [Lentisphaeria bacterium]
MKEFLISQSAEQLTQWCENEGFPKFRARQLLQWIREKLLIEPEKMLNLPETLRQKVKEHFFAPSMSVAEVASSADGVSKLLLELHDGEHIEMAIIPAGDGRVTFCLSTQVGCPVGCRFCASGKNGLKRNLLTGEILEEFLLGCQYLGKRCDNIVFMGIGEGLLNCNELFPALEMLTAPEGFALAPRRITVSTSGYVPGMLKFAGLQKEYNLAVSLHAPDEETRSKIIPDTLRFPIQEILSAVDNYREKAGRMVTLEYTLLAGINDSDAQAEALGRLAYAHHAKVNLIPYNSTGTTFRRPSRERIESFERAARATGAVVTRRIERGSGKNAACGQLRIKAEEKLS